MSNATHATTDDSANDPRAADVFVFPASFAQRRLWFIDQLDPGSPAYNAPAAFRVDGGLDHAMLERAVNEIVARHETMRTTFRLVDGEPSQVIASELRLRVPAVDLRTLQRDPRENKLAQLIEREARAPFDLAAGPLLRVTLVQLGETEHALLVTLHHIVTDMWSQEIFMRELTALYESFRKNLPSQLPGLPIQFADFAHWQREQFQGEALDRELAYWKQKLDGLVPLELPLSHARPATAAHRGKTLPVEIDEALAASLIQLAARERASLFMLVLAAWKTLLLRYTSQTDVSVGSPISNRSRAETESLIGFFLNMLVLRTDLAGDPPFRELLGRVRETALSAFAHDSAPFEVLVEKLHPSRAAGQNPLFNVAFVFMHGSEKSWSLPGLTLAPMRIEEKNAKFDLTVTLNEASGKITGSIEFNTDLFDEPFIARMAEHFQTLLKGIVADPATPLSRLPMLSAAEQQRILTEGSGSERPYPQDQTIAARFAECAAQTPAAIAVVEGGERLTYAELDARSNRVARFLHSRGIRAGDFVGLRAERSLAFVVKLTGIAKAGAAYVPLDAKEPAERLAAMKAACAFILDAEPDADLPSDPVVSEAQAGGPAYLLFTSGSTGVPKGVIVPHRGITRLVVNNDYAPFQPEDVVAFASNACFDAATFEIWGALLNGAKLVVVPQHVLLSTGDFAAFLAEHGVTTLFLTTALFNQIARQNPAALRPLKHVLFGGEACNPDCVRRVLDHGAPQRLIHVYGPTETTTFASWHLVREVPADAVTVPIGQPIANTTIHLLDSGLQPLPPGVIGEIFIGGPGVALGYLNEPELTAARFLETQFGRLYRTGDLARRRADGAIEFSGRIDSQLKLRGFRIEPGEIETALQRHASVRQAAVVVRETGQDRALVAYLVPGDASAPDDAEMRGFLRQHLPAPMVPSAFVWLPALPLTPNGKLDQRALPSPSASERDATGTTVAPRNGVESSILGIWEELLGRNSFSVHDDFFAVGGHSLLAIQLITRIRERFAVDLPVRHLFEAPTIERMAGYIAEHRPQIVTHSLVPIQRGHSAHRPFFLVPGGWGGELEFLVYGQLARHLGPELPFYGLKAHANDSGRLAHQSVPEMAAIYVAELRTIQPHGPYQLGGECVGGIVAHEMARRLVASGEAVDLLVLLDTEPPSRARLRQFVATERSERWQTFWQVRIAQPARDHLAKLSRLTLGEKFRYILERTTRRNRPRSNGSTPSLLDERKLLTEYPRVLLSHVLQPYEGKITLVIDETSHASSGTLGWEKLHRGGLDVHVLPGDHISYIREHRTAVATRLRELIRNANSSTSC